MSIMNRVAIAGGELIGQKGLLLEGVRQAAENGSALRCQSVFETVLKREGSEVGLN